MSAMDSFIAWLNLNQGFLSLILFTLTIFFGWASGIFSSLRRKPRYTLQLLPGPNFCTTFKTGDMYNEYEVHKTAISIYLRITNVGYSASSVTNVSVGYHWNLRPFSLNWIRYRVLWYWMENPTITMDDFHYYMGDKVKVYPSLFQGSSITGTTSETFLEVGRSVNGVVYFEQDSSWGGFFPIERNGKTKIRASVRDSFGKEHKKNFLIPVVSIEDAKKYNPYFGKTFDYLNQNDES